MARISFPDLADMSNEQRRQYERFPSNLARALVSATPELASHVMGLGGAFRRSTLDAKLRELVILRIATLSKSAYERMQHYEVAKSVGWTERELIAIETSRLEDFDRRATAVLRFTDECFKTFTVSDPTFRAAQAVLSDSDIAVLTLLIGQYVLTAIFVETLAIELDDRPTSWSGLTG